MSFKVVYAVLYIKLQIEKGLYSMAYFPMFIDLEKKKCMVVGGGEVAFRKVVVLNDFGAIIKVVSPEICGEIEEECRINKNIVCIKKCFDENDLNDVVLVVAATDDSELNHYISGRCKKRGIYVNVVDTLEDCGFIFPSYIREGNVVGAFSSSGKSPVITQYLKEQAKRELTPFIGELAEFLGSVREKVKKSTDSEKQRKAIYRKLLEISLDRGKLPDEEDLEILLKKRG